MQIRVCRLSCTVRAPCRRMLWAVGQRLGWGGLFFELLDKCRKLRWDRSCKRIVVLEVKAAPDS
jgi:hypothetical protein